ncbi:hypothetical protein BVY01_04210 [bacterium I07]|nr:hypothetical protein BVY01_04210 [bacterium I07]
MDDEKSRIKRDKEPVNGTNRSLKNTAWIAVSSLVIIALVFAVSQVYLEYRRSVQRMDELTGELVQLRSAMNIDSVRQYQIQKILGIMSTHNDNLSSVDSYDIASEIYEMSVKYTNLDVDLICAVITHESAGTWDPEVISPAGAMGLMQIMPVTGFFLANSEGIPWTTPEDIIQNPIYNIRMGTRFLSMLTNDYGLEGGLAAYNGGEKYAALWLKNGKDDQYLLTETRGYIPAVTLLYQNYQADGL